MGNRKLIEVLGEWEGYRFGTVGRLGAAEADGKRPAVWIELLPIRGRRRRCSGCNQLTDAIHDTEERFIRDLPILDADTWLLVHRVRVACPTCGPKVEALDSRWLLLRNYENIKREEDRVKLSELLLANRKLMAVYVLKDDIKTL